MGGLVTYSQGTSPTSIQSPSLSSYMGIYSELSASFNASPVNTYLTKELVLLQGFCGGAIDFDYHKPRKIRSSYATLVDI